MYGVTTKDLLGIALFLVLVGYGVLRGCEAGVTYVLRRVDIEWREDPKP